MPAGVNGTQLLLRVRAQDHGIPPRDAHMELEVTVVDVNDNAPQFDAPEYNIEVRIRDIGFILELTPYGNTVFILSLICIKNDNGGGATFSYSSEFNILVSLAPPSHLGPSSTLLFQLNKDLDILFGKI